MNLLDIVQRGVLDRGAGKEDRIHRRPRRERAALPHLPVHFSQHRDALLGWIFVRDRPARGLAGRSELLLLIEAIDPDHHAIDAIRKLGALVSEPFDLADDALH